VKQHVLIVGASGLVGYAALRHFETLADCTVTAVSRRAPLTNGRARFVSADLTDEKACAELFGRMTDVTHVVYAALFEKPGLMPGWFEQDQIATNDTMLRNLVEPLTKAARGLEHISVVHGAKAYGGHVRPIKVPAREDRDEHYDHPNFYWPQQTYIKEKQAGQSWAWTIFRPELIVGGAIGCAMNLIPVIGAYAALLKEQGEPLAFPGGPPYVWEATDADLLARAFAWAGEAESARNQAFNVTNGDVLVWQNVWPAIADALGMEFAEAKPRSMAAMMSDASTVGAWDAIREKYRLAAPPLKEFLGESHHYADFCFGYGAKNAIPAHLLSNIKIRKAGFADCVDSEAMFRHWIKVFQDARLLPAL
jgi:nucleoside-diphosphate-sugar epimerase